MTSSQRLRGVIDDGKADRLLVMPITMQFAADRIGRKYLDYTTDHRVLVEAQLRVAEEFGFDHVSAISDPAREVADCGAKIIPHPDSPPAIDKANPLLADKTTLAKLRTPNPYTGPRMSDRIRAVEELSRQVGRDKIVEGWIEGPCTQAAALRGINALMFDFHDDDKFIADLFEFIIDMELSFARAQVQAGATLIGIGDPAASLVSPDIYEHFILQAEKKLLQKVQELGVMVRLHICGNTSSLLEYFNLLGAEIIDLDHTVSLIEARKIMPGKQVLMGNIDPVHTLRDGTPDSVYTAIGKCHLAVGPHYIVGAGREVYRDTHPDNVLAMSRYAREHQP